MGATFEPTRIGDTVSLYLGDCIEVLRTLPSASVDAIVTDPPAGIAFMGKAWDTDKGGRNAWIAWMAEVAAECLRVVKPGGHALVWALPRTSHWTGMAWEEAGWEPRDKIVHLFGTGFPKSLDVGKAIDKAAGAEREVVGYHSGVPGMTSGKGWNDGPFSRGEVGAITAPATDAARQWHGWGTALKPAAEDWWLLRKPLAGTVAANVTAYGTGALNIDGCRVPHDENLAVERVPRPLDTQGQGWGFRAVSRDNAGRWPANVLHDGSDEVVAGFPDSKTTRIEKPSDCRVDGSTSFDSMRGNRPARGYDGEGSAARFFYCAKASRADREEGCEHLPARSGAEAIDREEGSAGTQSPRAGAGRTAEAVRNHHPTVKNVELMRYLCRLITPPNGLILDPFTGSGSTGKGAVLEGFRFAGIERDPEYLQIAAARIAAAAARAPRTAERPETATAPNGGTSDLTGKAAAVTVAPAAAPAQLSLLDALDAL